MNILYLKPTHTTPEIRLNNSEKVLSLRGRSSPENSLVFYQKIFNTLDQYFQEHRELRVNLMYEYFNTSSSKCLFVLFRQLKQYIEKGYDIRINWYYEEYDDDMMETGEDYADIIEIDVNLIMVPDIHEPVYVRHPSHR